MSRLNTVIQHPYHQYLGVTDIRSQDGRGQLSIEVTDRTINPAGVLHGGVVYTLCDVCAYAGLLSQLAPDQEAVTHDLHVSVMRPAKLGDVVMFESEIVKQGKSLCFLDVKATVNGSLLATARVTKSLVLLNR